MTHDDMGWMDGRGHYAPGSDTANAPWNKPDAPEPDQSDYEAAAGEIYPFVEFQAEATLNDVLNACDYLSTDETCQVAEICEACDKPNPLLAVGDQLKAEVMKQARAWADERAEDERDLRLEKEAGF